MITATSKLFLARTELLEFFRVFMGNAVKRVLIQKGRSFATTFTVVGIRGLIIIPLSRYLGHRWAFDGTVVVPTLPDAKCI